MYFTSVNDVGGHGPATRCNPELHQVTRGSERPETRKIPDVGQLLKTTSMSLAFIGLVLGDRPKSGSTKGKVLLVYRTLVMFVLLAGSGWRVSMESDIVHLVTLKYNIWTLQAIAHFAIFYAISIRWCDACPFLEAWRKYRRMYRIESGLIKRKSKVCACVIWLISIFTAIFNGYQTFPGFPMESLDMFYITLLFVVGFYLLFTCVASATAMLLISSLLAQEYQLIRQQILQTSQVASHLVNQHVGDTRKRHWELSQVVCKADDIFCAHLGLSSVASIVLTCLGIYTMIWDTRLHGNSAMSVVECTWFLFALIKLTSDCVAAVKINDAVSSIN